MDNNIVSAAHHLYLWAIWNFQLTVACYWTVLGNFMVTQREHANTTYTEWGQGLKPQS